MTEGWQGWDQYAPFYDWENARTVGRRDVAFWRRLAAEQSGRILELGCGTGRIALPILKAGGALVGVDRSDAMLARARARARRASIGRRAKFVRADIRALPFRPRAFNLVMAPYGILQSLTRERDLQAALASAARVLRRGGLFGIDLVPDLPRWQEYAKKVSLHGRRNATTTLTLVESVRQDRRRRLTIFDQEYIERRGRNRRVHRFALTFRTLSVPQMTARLEAAGFSIRATLGDYQGRAWDDRADVWVILARKI
jgi:ubiquinone/menaquinone biosynthesis C-methylase UbiE